MLYHFEGHALDTERRELRRGADLIAVEPQVFDLLAYLICNRNRVVSKDDVFDAVWEGRIVSESALTSRINAARGAIGDNGEAQRLIRTLRGKGFRFVGPVQEAERLAAAAAQPAPANAAGALSLPERPSIAVLPFTNMSGDPQQDHFADGIVADIIAALSHLRWLFVIARNSTFTYKGQAIDVRQVGRELGVRYVLEGSVRRLGNQVRIGVQLIEAESGTHIWAQRYDRAVENVFAVQDEITDAIAGALEPEISASERERARRKRPEHLGAWELYQHGMWHFLQYSPEHWIEAQNLFRHAILLDTAFAAPHAALALAKWWAFQWTRVSSDDPAAVASEMFKEASRAVELDPNDALGHVALGLAFIHRQQLTHAIAEVETALSLNPSSAYAHFTYGQMLTRIDRCEEALEQCDAALRLSPRDPNTWRYLSLRASALYLLRRYEEAAKSAREASRHPTADAIWPYIYLAAASAHLGETTEAAEALAALREKRPNLTISWLLSWPNFRIRSQATLDHMIEGMRKAGVPE